MCGTVWHLQQLAEECSADCRARARGRDNVPRWDSYCIIIDDTFALPGTAIASEMLADYICDYLEEDDRDTGPSDHSVDIARRVAVGLIPISAVTEAVKSSRK